MTLALLVIVGLTGLAGGLVVVGILLMRTPTPPPLEPPPPGPDPRARAQADLAASVARRHTDRRP